jgi:hypothetical protein
VVAGKPDKTKRPCKEGCQCEPFFAKTEEDEKERKWQFAFPKKRTRASQNTRIAFTA